MIESLGIERWRMTSSRSSHGWSKSRSNRNQRPTGKSSIALAKLVAEDPSFRVSTDQEFGQTILKGMDELHLDIKVDILKRTYKVDANVGAPQVAFRERLTQRVEVEYTHKRVLGRKGEFAHVRFVVEPNEPGKGFGFKIVGNAVPTEYIPGIEKGIESVLSFGVVAGFPVVDVKVQLVDGKHHDVDRRCGRSRLHRARHSARPY